MWLVGRRHTGKGSVLHHWVADTLSFAHGGAIMNYQLHYDRLVEKGRLRALQGYSERHHILPKSLGGGEEAENLVRFTAREHFIAHLLLAKIHGGKMLQAVFFMSALGSGKLHSRMYEKARIELVDQAYRRGKEFAERKIGVCGRSAEQMTIDGKKAGSVGGRRQIELGVGIHAQSREDRVRMGREAVENRTGIHALSPEKKRENSLKGAARIAEMIRSGERKHFGDPAASSRNIGLVNSRVYRCSECGLESRACGIGLHQKATGHVGRIQVR